MSPPAPGRVALLRRAARNLRVRVTAAATVAAVVLAVLGAVVFAVLFERSLLGSTDDALRTIAASTTAELAATSGTPALAPVPANARTTLLQVIGPDGTVRQTVQSSTSPARTVVDGRSALASAADVTAAAGGEVSTTTGHDRVLLTPFTRADGTWVLLVATDLEQVEDAAHDAEVAFFVVVPIVVVLIAIGAWALSGAVLRPVERIRADAAALRAGAGDGRVAHGRVHQPDSGDHIEALSRTLNGLLGDLAGASQRQRHLVADAGHELRTPLAVLRTELELADRDTRDVGYLRDAVSHARTEVDRLSALAEDLLLLADAENRVHRDARPVAVADLVEDSVRAHRGVAGERGLTLATTTTGDTRVPGEAGALRRAIDNLLGNALAVARSHVEVVVHREDAAVVLEITDDGPGFAPDFLPHAFERFRRADDDRHRTGPGGAGLGLAIVAAVASAHGGGATAANTGDGARLTVTLPTG